MVDQGAVLRQVDPQCPEINRNAHPFLRYLLSLGQYLGRRVGRAGRHHEFQSTERVRIADCGTLRCLSILNLGAVGASRFGRFVERGIFLGAD